MSVLRQNSVRRTLLFLQCNHLTQHIASYRGPMFPEPTIKNIIPLFKIKNFYIRAACLYHFNKGIALLYYRKNKIPIFFKQQLRYKLNACKNNSLSLRMKLNNRFPRRFLLISCHPVPRVHLKTY